MFHKHGGDIYSYGKVRDFSANINYRGMPEQVAQAAADAVQASVHYPDPAYRSLRAALAAREGVNSAHILCGNGAAELMFALAAAQKPGRALLAVPSFFEYEQALASFGCEIRYFYLKKEQGFSLTEAFADAIGEGTDIVVLGNPNNPTGRLIEAKVLQKILDACSSRGVFLVLDESFFDFLCEEDQARTFGGVPQIENHRNLFVLKSFTKMYAMPGLRFGYGVCADEELLSRMRMVMQPWNVSLPAAAAAQAAAGETGFAAETARQNAKNRREMKRWLEEAGYPVFGSDANFLLFAGSPDLGSYCAEHGFLIRDCSNFPGLGPEPLCGSAAGTQKGRQAEAQKGWQAEAQKGWQVEAQKGWQVEAQKRRQAETLVYYRTCVRSSEENAELVQVLRAFQESHQ